MDIGGGGRVNAVVPFGSSIVNQPSRILVEVQERGNSYQKRNRSLKTEELLSLIVEYVNHHLPCTSQTPTTSLKRKRNELGELSTGHILKKLYNRGYLSILEVLDELWKLASPSQYLDATKKYDYYMRRTPEDIIEFLQILNTRVEVKRFLNVCCTLDRTISFYPVACDGCEFLIAVGANCFSCEVSVGKSLYVCATCHKKNGHDVIIKRKKILPNGLAEIYHTTIAKTEFLRTTYGTSHILPKENTVSCVYCFTPFHRICISYDEFNTSSGYSGSGPNFTEDFHPAYVCDKCVLKIHPDVNPEFINKRRILFDTSTMRTTRLSEFMESELHDVIYKLCAKSEGQTLPSKICVREVHSRYKTFQVKPRMRKEYEKKNMPTEFEYLERSIMVYQHCKSTKTDVAVFNVIFQEYEREKLIYISYLDSVQLFNPPDLRSSFYKYVIVSYLKYIKMDNSREFDRLVIWACPPKPGDEYVFFGRPEAQQTIGNAQLNRWYKDLFKKCIESGVVDTYEEVGAHNNPYGEYINVPYIFEDFWCDRLETLLLEYDRDVLKHEVNNQETRRNGLQKSVKQKNSGLKSKLDGIQERFARVIETECDNTIILAKLKKDSGSDVRQNGCQMTSISSEPHIKCHFMSTRDNFLSSCREKCYDFRDERRASYATLFMHSRMAEESINTKCNHCDRSIPRGWYCRKCPNVVICKNCTGRHQEIGCNKRNLHRFVLPYSYPANPDDLHEKILLRLEAEAKFLMQFAELKASWDGNIPAHIHHSVGEYVARTFDLHSKDLNVESTGHDPAKCQICEKVWHVMERHRLFCKGLRCNVPSCMKKV